MKQILKKSGFWIYDNPFGLIEINSQIQQWDSLTWLRLSKLNPEDIISVEVIESNGLVKPTKERIKLMLRD